MVAALWKGPALLELSAFFDSLVFFVALILVLLDVLVALVVLELFSSFSIV